jgi:hypothetical protein
MDENPLEQSLRLAASEPAHRPEFCRLLLASTVFVLGSSDQPMDGKGTLQAGAKIQIQNWAKPDGSPIIPFFSSLAALQCAIEQQTNYLALPAKSLFEMTRGAHLILNPKSDYGKEFVPAEVGALLSEGVSSLPDKRIIEKATQVLLGQPKIYPSAMVTSLATLFSKRKDVKAAYLVLMHDTSIDKEPHLVVGIEAENNFEEIVLDAGVVVSSSLPKNECVDFIRVIPGEAGVCGYMIKNIKPFYERTWCTKLKSFLASGQGSR